MTTPRRRWFRFVFSLRTVFVVVTVLSAIMGWAGWNWELVQQRQKAIDASDAAYPSNLVISSQWDWEEKIGRLPWIRRIMGDMPIRMLILPTDRSDKESLRVMNLFPESVIFSADGSMIQDAKLHPLSEYMSPEHQLRTPNFSEQ